MCKGAEEVKHGGFCKSFTAVEVPFHGSARGSISCELCGLKASLYCHADNAYLCRQCDGWVHKANFLALRHIRSFLCNVCQNLTRRCLIGASTEVVLPNIASLDGANPPNNVSDKKCSSILKDPFLFL